jgi:Prolyl oligopeptidase family
MYKRVTLLLLSAALSFSCSSQTLISATLLGAKTQAQLYAQFNNLLFIQYGCKYYRIAYTSPDVHGVLDTVTGLLAVPDNPNKKYPRLVYQHGTSGSRQDVPSINVVTNGEGQFGQLFAGLGYVALLPDYLGLGNVSRGFHPYVHAESEAWVAMDMLRAVQQFCAQNQIQTNDQLFVTGYSQGGHGAMALHRAIEKDPAHEFTVTAAAPMSGPYSISGVMRDLILSDDIYYYPAYIPNTALSYQTVYGNLFNNVTEVFRAPYSTLIAQFQNGTINLSSLNDQLIDMLIMNEGACRPFRMLQPNMVQTIMNDPNHPINLALAANDAYDNWIPQAPIRLFYCMNDDQVPFLNSLLARDSLNAVSAPNFQIQDVMPSANHGQCVVPAATATVIFFLGFQQIGTVGTDDVAAVGKLNISPNPASEALFLRDLPSPGRFELIDLQGKRILSKYLDAGSHRIPLIGAPPGNYAAVFGADGKRWVTMVVVER